MIDIDGYCLIRVNSSSRFTGGVCIYVKSEYNSKIENIHVLEKNTWAVNVEIRKNKDILRIVCLYHSPNSSHGQFLNIFEQILDELIISRHPIFLVGDYNIHWNTFYSEKLKKIVTDANVIQTVQNRTHITKSSSSIIDLVITNVDVKCEILSKPKMTDHQIVSFCIPKKEVAISNKKRIRSRENVNYIQFNDNLKKTDWQVVYRTRGLVGRINLFFEIFF